LGVSTEKKKKWESQQHIIINIINYMKMDATCGYMPPSGDQCQICRVLGTS
jgi:hypothetical protein